MNLKPLVIAAAAAIAMPAAAQINSPQAKGYVARASATLSEDGRFRCVDVACGEIGAFNYRGRRVCGIVCGTVVRQDCVEVYRFAGFGDVELAGTSEIIYAVGGTQRSFSPGPPRRRSRTASARSGSDGQNGNVVCGRRRTRRYPARRTDRR